MKIRIERVDETRDDRTADELHQQVEFQQRSDELKDAHQDRRGEQIFDAMIAHQRHHHHGHGSSRGGDHAGAPAGKRDNHRDRDRGIEANARVHPCDDREADRLGDQRQRDDDAREHIGPDVAEPFALPSDCLAGVRARAGAGRHGKSTRLIGRLPSAPCCDATQPSGVSDAIE